MGLVKTRRLAHPPLAGADDPWGSRQAERCECRAMQKHPPTLKLLRTWQRAIHLRQGYGGLKAGLKPPLKKPASALPPHLYKCGGNCGADLVVCPA